MGSRLALASLAAIAVAGCGLDRFGLLQGGSDAGSSPGDDASNMLPMDASGADGTLANDAKSSGSGSSSDSSSGAVDDVAAHDTSASDSTGGPPDATIKDSGGSDAPATGYPATCAQAGADAGDENVTLYVGGDPNEPWSAHCSGGKEYLPLGSGSPNNFSSYPVASQSSCARAANGPATVTTKWTMVRIDPSTLIVDTSDYRGAQSMGSTYEVSGNGMYMHTYSAMPYAAARSCDDQQPSSAAGGIDLSATPFAVATAQTWSMPGWSNNDPGNAPYGGANPLDGKTVSLSIGGYPAGITGCQNDYYQTTGGPCLQLVYSP